MISETGIHAGARIHHHDQLMTCVSLRTMNVRSISVVLSDVSVFALVIGFA